MSGYIPCRTILKLTAKGLADLRHISSKVSYDEKCRAIYIRSGAHGSIVVRRFRNGVTTSKDDHHPKDHWEPE